MYLTRPALSSRLQCAWRFTQHSTDGSSLRNAVVAGKNTETNSKLFKNELASSPSRFVRGAVTRPSPLRNMECAQFRCFCLSEGRTKCTSRRAVKHAHCRCTEECLFHTPKYTFLQKQAVLEGRQQLPSDYWKEFARGPYLIIVGEGMIYNPYYHTTVILQCSRASSRIAFLKLMTCTCTCTVHRMFVCRNTLAQFNCLLRVVAPFFVRWDHWSILRTPVAAGRQCSFAYMIPGGRSTCFSGEIVVPSVGSNSYWQHFCSRRGRTRRSKTVFLHESTAMLWGTPIHSNPLTCPLVFNSLPLLLKSSGH